MHKLRLRIVLAVLIASVDLAACKRADSNPDRKPIGQSTTELGVRIGSIWGGGYSVRVFPSEYVVVEHASCPMAKESDPFARDKKGFCVVRLTQAQSDRFETAMKKFERSAIPLQSIAVDDPWVRPDLKPCKSQWTDSTVITLTWTGTRGVKMATFYTGCDREELGAYYKEALAVTDFLPIQDIIRQR